MKKILLVALVGLIAFSCKRKENLVEPNGTLADHANHCYNGLLDGDEVSIDCGGECTPCNFATPSCSPPANTIKIGASSYTMAGTSCGTPSGQFEMDGTYGDGTLTIDIGESAPDVTVGYNIIYGVPLYHEASIHLSSGSYGGLTLNSGTLYFSLSGGKYVATICNASAYSFVTAQTYTITGNFSCP